MTKFEHYVNAVLLLVSKFLYLKKKIYVGTKLDFVHCTSVFQEVTGDPS